MHFFANIFRRPVRQAYAWAAVGVLGLAFAAGGVMLLTSGSDDGSARSSAPDDATPTPKSTPIGSATAASTSPGSSPSAIATASTETPTTTPTAVVTPTSTPEGQQNPTSGGGGQPTAQPTPVPSTPVPTQPPAASRAYCGTISSTAPPSSVFGLLTIGGQPAPAGTIATATFDGVTGPSQASTAAGGYRVDFPSGGDDCANRSGAALAIIINGQAFPTGAVGNSPATRVDITIP